MVDQSHPNSRSYSAHTIPRVVAQSNPTLIDRLASYGMFRRLFSRPKPYLICTSFNTDNTEMFIHLPISRFCYSLHNYHTVQWLFKRLSEAGASRWRRRSSRKPFSPDKGVRLKRSNFTNEINTNPFKFFCSTKKPI